MKVEAKSIKFETDPIGSLGNHAFREGRAQDNDGKRAET